MNGKIFEKKKNYIYIYIYIYIYRPIQSDTKKGELLKNPTKIEEIQEKNY